MARAAPGRRDGRRVALSSSDRPIRIAYADPPYPGLAARYYRDHPDYGGEVDHGELVARLVREYPDGWALSTSAAALPDVLALCPPGVRVAAWFRGERPVKSYRPLSAWEPVIYFGGRAVASPLEERRLDALIHRARPRTTDPRRVIGAKPVEFCYWMFSLLGALPGDELVDLYPGSGIVSRCWAHYAQAQGALDPSLLDPHDGSATSPARRPRLLDLFCSAGGASRGYAEAGFDVVGVDIAAQRRYPYEFIQADALDVLRDRDFLAGFDAIHASPPCQEHTQLKHLRAAAGWPLREHGGDLLPEVRAALTASGVPWVVENVPGAPLEAPLVLCGSMFGLSVRRHRLFESSVPLSAPGPCRHREQGKPVGVYGRGYEVMPSGARTAHSVAEARDAMGIDWMTWPELTQAIPPAYTAWIGTQLLAAVRPARAVVTSRRDGSCRALDEAYVSRGDVA